MFEFTANKMYFLDDETGERDYDEEAADYKIEGSKIMFGEGGTWFELGTYSNGKIALSAATFGMSFELVKLN
ncbi:MAG: hypothetical protein FWE23_05050 [Chitinivibrionia bacterium]|nr:hypothetical protein [Chitinivibrionia bacterium]